MNSVWNTNPKENPRSVCQGRIGPKLLPIIQSVKLNSMVTQSFWVINGHNKKYLKSLSKKYLDFCKESININDYKVIYNCPLDLNLDIYNPDNVLKFMEEKCYF